MALKDPISIVSFSIVALASTYFLTKRFRKDMGVTRLSSYARTSDKGLPFDHAVFSHRGGALEFVENTMPGFRYSACQLKADVLEMDVQLTRDGQVVIFHDDTLDRMTGRLDGKRIGDFDYADLPRLVIPPHLLDKSEVVKDLDSTRIPLLKELLDEFPVYPMQIDVKRGPEELVIKVGEMMKTYKRETQTVWGSFRPSVNKMCVKHFGAQIPLFFSLPRALYLKALWHIGLFNENVDIIETCLIMPNHWLFTNKSWIEAMKKRRVSIIVFGMGTGALNDPSLWHQVRNLGATGICSDKPTLLREWLQTYPL